jgi:hypothetical protein
MNRMKEKASERVSSERTLEERLREYPELRARFEEMLAIVENADGDIVKADDAEERVIQELRQLGQSALQGWAERKQRRVQRESEGESGIARKVKKTVLVHAAGPDRDRGTNL